MSNRRERQTRLSSPSSSWLLFPPLRQRIHLQPRQRQREPRRERIQCTLNLFANGTFVLAPTTTTTATAPAPSDDYDGHFQRGQWTLHKNPYCATDRFYDTLTLQTLPRRTCHVVVEEGEEDEDSNNHNTLQGTFVWHARLYGHYSRRNIHPRTSTPHQYYANLACGTCLWEPQQQKQQQQEQQQPLPTSRIRKDTATQLQLLRHRWTLLIQQHQGKRQRNSLGWHPHRRTVVATFDALKTPRMVDHDINDASEHNSATNE